MSFQLKGRSQIGVKADYMMIIDPRDGGDHGLGTQAIDSIDPEPRIDLSFKSP